MTERGSAKTRRSADALQIGNSTLHWDGGDLVAQIDEISAPIPGRVRGIVRLSPETATGRRFALDAGSRHEWTPLAPRAHVAVDFAAPALRWSGTGYLDANFGAEPLERGFSHWTWARAHLREDIAIFYDASRRDGSHRQLALRVDRGGDVQCVTPPQMTQLPRTGWGLDRAAWRDGDVVPGIRRTLEDTPFYARTALDGRCFGERATIMHESLSLDRLRTPIVRAMLPFRMPRLV